MIEEKFYKIFYDNPLAWGMFYFQDHFRDTSPYFHLKILKESLRNRKLAIASPRESAKSTILTFLRPIHDICFKKRRFIVIVQNTFKKAAGSLETIKWEIKSNKKLKKDFKIDLIRDAEGDTIFIHKDGYEVRVLCKGAEQIGSVRGEKFGAYRPDLIIMDDLEDDIMVRNPENRKAMKDLVDFALIPAGDRKLCQYLFIGTVLHDDSVMSKLVSTEFYKDFKKLFYQALWANTDTNRLESLWPEKWTVEELKEMRRVKPDVFAKEYQNDPVSGSQARFQKTDFRMWKRLDDDYILYNSEGEVIGKGSLRDCRAGIACDLAWEEKRAGDFSVIMPAYLTTGSDLLVEDYVCKKGMRPDEIQEILFSMEARLKALTSKSVPIGFEKAKLEKVIKHLLKQSMRKRNKFLIFKDLQWDGDKIQRIVTRLQPRYAQKTIYHKHGMGDLEYQLLRIPSGTHEDLCFAKGTKVATLLGDRNIEDIRVGDFVITPNGINRVLSMMMNGRKRVIDRFGLRATPNHPVFDAKKGLVQIDSLWDNKTLSTLTKEEILSWRYRNLLNSMEKSIKGWVGKENIILVSQIQIKDGRILKDFMWRCGSFITKRKYLKAMKFIIKTGIVLITTQAIWSVYRLASIGDYIFPKGMKSLGRRIENIWLGLGHYLQNGIDLRKEESGIEFMGKKDGRMQPTKNMFVSFVEPCSSLELTRNRSFVPTIMRKSTRLCKEDMKVSENVSSAEYYSQLRSDGSKQNVVLQDVEPYMDIEDVYNITVDKAHMYYANGILVGNCDALQGIVQILEYAPTLKKEEKEDAHFDWLLKRAHKDKRSGKSFVFGRGKKIEIPHKESFL